jgi:hypothetical protein
MRQGICDKCGARTVRAGRNGITSESITSFRPNLEPGFRGIARPHRGEAWQFVCTSCGYLEWHVLDAATLDFIAQNWAPVTPAQ